MTDGGEDDTEVDAEAWKEKGSYEAGYTEALSDLHRGFYEGWVTEQSGDFEGMADFIVEAVREYNGENKIQDEEGGEDDMEYCKIGGCDREQHVDSQDGMCLPCGVAYESGWHDCFDEKVRGVRGRQEIQEKYEELKENYSGHIGDSYKGKTLRWVLGGVDDL